jgi:hypothetical protein
MGYLAISGLSNSLISTVAVLICWVCLCIDLYIRANETID